MWHQNNFCTGFYGVEWEVKGSRPTLIRETCGSVGTNIFYYLFNDARSGLNYIHTYIL